MNPQTRDFRTGTIAIAVIDVEAFLLLRNNDDEVDNEKREPKIGLVNQIPDFEAMISGFQPGQSGLSYEAEDVDMILSIGTGFNIAAQTAENDILVGLVADTSGLNFERCITECRCNYL